MSDTKIETEARSSIAARWPEFSRLRDAIAGQTQAGRRLSERDVERILEALVEGPLGWEVGQLARQQDFADFALIDRGLKLAVIETKGYGVFRDNGQLRDALTQGARYADRHRTPLIWACDGCRLVLASKQTTSDCIAVHVEASLCTSEPEDALYYFTHYGLFRCPTEVIETVPYSVVQDDALYKRHHGVMLHYSCCAYVGDLRDKGTWMMPYRNEDCSVDVSRIGHAVNFLLSPGGYRGQKAEGTRIPEAATMLCALRLARGYRDIGRWCTPDRPFSSGHKPDPQTMLWLYLHQHGIDEPCDVA